MACFYPLTAYRSKNANEDTGRRPLVFKSGDSIDGVEIKLPCGRCIGCRLEYSRQWAIRCVHEAQLYDENAFLTLTYDQEHCPEDYSVSVREIQTFMKRLRKQTGIKLRFLACGEYGEKFSRPHYHFLIFGYGFPDKYLDKMTDAGELLYRSPLLESVWKKGRSLPGIVTED